MNNKSTANFLQTSKDLQKGGSFFKGFYKYITTVEPCRFSLTKVSQNFVREKDESAKGDSLG